VTGDGIVGDTETALFVRLMELHVNPSTVLGPRLVCLPGLFLEKGVADLPIDMLLLEGVLIRLVYPGESEHRPGESERPPAAAQLAVEVLKGG
jgi:hypothetical protein